MAAKATARKTTARPARKAGPKSKSTRHEGRRAAAHPAGLKTRPHSPAGTDGVTAKRSAKAPPAASIAAAQKVLQTVERREGTLRRALKRQKQDLRQLKRTAARHRATVKSLKADLDDVTATRKKVARQL